MPGQSGQSAKTQAEKLCFKFPLRASGCPAAAAADQMSRRSRYRRPPAASVRPGHWPGSPGESTGRPIPEHGLLHSPCMSRRRAEASGWPAASAASLIQCAGRRGPGVAGGPRPAGPGSRLTGTAADRPRCVLLQVGHSRYARIGSLARARRHWQRHGGRRGPAAGISLYSSCHCIMIAGPGPLEMEPQPERGRKPEAESSRPARPSRG